MWPRLPHNLDYNERGYAENQVKETKNPLRRDKACYQGFEANLARMKLVIPHYNFVHMIRQFIVCGKGD
jgi:hypothetical protein